MLEKFNFFSKKSFRYATIGSVSIRFGSAFFAFLNGILLARLLSVEGLGKYVLVFSTITVLSIPATMGIPQLLTRYVSKYEVHNKESLLKGLLIKTNRFVFFSTLLIYALASISYFFWWKNYGTEMVYTIIYGLILLPILGFGALRSASLRGLKLIILAELPETLFRNLLFTVFLSVNFLLGYNLTPKWAMLFQVIAAGIGFLIGYLFLRRHLLLKLRNVRPLFEQKHWIKETIPFSINSGVQVTRSKLLTYVLAIFGSVEAVAIFEVATRGATLVSFTLNALNTAISPFISTAFEKGDKIYLQKIIRKTGRIIFAFSLPVALLFIFGGTTLLTFIFGAQYENAYIPLVILCIGQLVSSMVGSVGLLLSMTGNQRVFSNSNLLMLILNVILSIPLIIYLDVIGASIVYSLLLIVQNLVLLSYVRKKLKINTAII